MKKIRVICVICGSKINIMTSNVSNQERWRQIQRSFEDLAEDMDTVLNIIDEMGDFDASAATELCKKVRRTNPHDSVEYPCMISW